MGVEGKPVEHKVMQQSNSDKQSGLQLFSLMSPCYELKCYKLTWIRGNSSKNRCKFLLRGQPQWTKYQGQLHEPEVQRPSFARISTGRWQIVAQHGGAVQVKALPELWISFSLLLFPGALYLPSFFSLP